MWSKRLLAADRLLLFNLVIAWSVKDREEDEIKRKLARSILQRHRYRVLAAASSVEALMFTQHHRINQWFVLQ